MALRNACLLVAAMLFGLAACTSKSDFSSHLQPTVVGDTTLARKYVEIAEQFYIEGEYDSLLHYYDKARAEFEAAGDWPRVVHCHGQRGKFFLKTARPDDARAEIERGFQAGFLHLREDHPALSTLHDKKGLLALWEERFPDAEKAFLKALSLLEKANTAAPSHLLADVYQNLGILKIAQSELTAAHTTLNKALHIRLNFDGSNNLDLVTTYSEISDLLKLSGEYDRAIDTLAKAVTIGIRAGGVLHPELAILYKDLGETHRLKGEYEKAFYFHEEGLRVVRASLSDHHPHYGPILNALGIAYAEYGYFDKAVHYYKAAIEVNEKLYGANHSAMATHYGNLGITYREMGDYERAMELMNHALMIDRSRFSGSSRQIAIRLNNIGKVYKDQGEYEIAEDLWTQSLRMFIDVHGVMHPYVANQYRAIGEVLLEKGSTIEAIHSLDRALQIFKGTTGGEDPYIGSLYSSLAAAYDSLADTHWALKLYEKAVRYQGRKRGSRHPLVAQAWNDLAEFHRRNQSYTTALASYHSALAANTCNQAEMDPSYEECVLFEPEWIRSHWGIARVRLHSNFGTPNYTRNLASALDSFAEAVRSIDRFRRTIKGEGSKLRRAEIEAPLLADAVKTSLDLFRQSGDETYKNLAFFFAEKSKSGLLLEAFSDARAKQYAGIPDSLLEVEKAVTRSLTAAEQRLIKAQASGSRDSVSPLDKLERDVFLAKQKRHEFISRLEREFPAYHHAKYEVEVASPQLVQSKLVGENTALIEYLVGENEIYIFSVSEKAFDAIVVPIISPLEDHVQKLREGIVEQDFALYTEHASYLYGQLIAPIASMLDVSNVIIVPDDVLSYVPFEALLTGNVPADESIKDYSLLPYLINQYEISYAYSATLLIEAHEKSTPSAEQDFMAFAPVFEGGLPIASRGAELLQVNGKLDSRSSKAWLSGYLPMTRTEVKSIYKLFTSRYSVIEKFFSAKAKVYLDRKASEKNLKESSLESYRYVHFATHSFANASNPEATGIIMYPEESTSTTATGASVPHDDAEEDGVLRLGEVYNLKLNADLVVLSACETGLGPVARGEGILSLTRGFLYAGASNVLVSLWNADDSQTSALMVDFYKELLDGSSKPEALRSAKLNIIRAHPRYARPYYWAPFVLIGK